MTPTATTSSPRVLITGACGFLGSHAALAVAARWPEAQLHRTDLRFDDGISCDLLDRSVVQAMIEHLQPTHVIHAAGLHGQAPPKDQFLVHAAGTEHLLSALATLRETARIVNLGSSSQYGKQDPAREFELIETHADLPVSAYAVSKAAQEQLVRASEAKGAVRAVCLRIFNPIGPKQTGQLVLPDLIRRLSALKDGDELVIGNLDSVRDFVDARDVGQAIAQCLMSDAAYGERLNICSGVATTVGELVKRLVHASGLEVRVRVDSTVTRPPDIAYQRGSCAKIERLIGWKPDRALATTIEDAWRSR